MITQLPPELAQPISQRFGSLPDDTVVSMTAAALEANGIRVLRAADAADTAP